MVERLGGNATSRDTIKGELNPAMTAPFRMASFQSRNPNICGKFGGAENSGKIPSQNSLAKFKVSRLTFATPAWAKFRAAPASVEGLDFADIQPTPTLASQDRTKTASSS